MRLINRPKSITQATQLDPNQAHAGIGRRATYRKVYLLRLQIRPKWADRYLEKLLAKGTVPTRCLDGRFWMCIKAGFKPMQDIHWDWWCTLTWIDQNWFYDQAIEWHTMGRQIREKDDPNPTLNRAIA